jgi:hypothetical protein
MATPLRPNFVGAVSISPSVVAVQASLRSLRKLGCVAANPASVTTAARYGFRARRPSRLQADLGGLNRRSQGKPAIVAPRNDDSRRSLNQNTGATHDRGIQEICSARKRRRSRHWGDHRRRLRRDRQLAGGGHHVTDHRRSGWPHPLCRSKSWTGEGSRREPANATRPFGGTSKKSRRPREGSKRRPGLLDVIAGHSALKTRVNALMTPQSIFFERRWTRGSSPRVTGGVAVL